ncbi:MAG: TonB-dependent receptor [Pseudomonadota bacterium]
MIGVFRSEAATSRLLSVAFLAAALLGGTGLHAQDITSRNLNIGAQPLSETLTTLGELFGVPVVAPADLVRGKQAASISGELRLEAALRKALMGTNLTSRSTAGGAVVIEPKAAVPAANAPAKSGGNAESTLELESIIVRGELLERSIQDVQTSVSVVAGETLDRSVDKDLFDVIDRIPGVNAQGGGFGFVMRGISSNGVGGGSGPTINVQIDGANVPNGQAVSTGALSTWDLEQIEVLRGPQSTQQGRRSLAGAIILRSRDPSFDNEVKLRADYGSFDETRLAAAVNVPLSEQWAARLTYEDYQSDGDIVNIFTGEDNAFESLQTIRGKLRFQPNNRFNAVLSYTRSENELGDQSIDDSAFPDERQEQDANSTEGVTDSVALLLDYSLSDRWRLVSETTDLTSDYALEIPIQPLNPVSSPGGRTVDDTSFTQEFKLLYTGERVRGVIGAFYQELEKDVAFEAFLADGSRFGFPPGVSVRLGNSLASQIDNTALFGEVTYDYSDRWSFVAGVRADRQEEASTSSQFFELTPDPFGISGTTPSVDLNTDYSAVLPKLAAVYRFSDDVSLSFTAQQAYRAGGSAINIVFGQYEFDPEFANNYELALRSVFLDGRATFNANLYLTDYTDMQVSVPGPSGLFLDAFIENAGEATLWGIEVLSSLTVNSNVDLYANVGFASTEFDDYIGPGADGSPTDFTGNRFPEAPEWTGSIGGNFDLGRGFNADLSINYTDESFYTPRNLPAELNEPFTLVNARIGYQSSSFWSAHLYARNLLDEQYLARRRADGFSSAGDSRVVGISFFAEF